MAREEWRGFGPLLRYWRGVRKRSQLDLSMASGVSSRHLSYLETSRSAPSREMVLRLAQTLDVPLRERNALLGAAGFGPIYCEADLKAGELAPVLRSIEFILARHDPYPALLVDRHWNVLRQNAASVHWFSRFVAVPSAFDPPFNSILLLIDQRGLRPYVTNWEELAVSLVQRLHRELASVPNDGETRALLDRLLACDGVPDRCRVPNYMMPQHPVFAMRIERDGVCLNLFSVISTVGTPLDVTLQELRIDTFFPADDATDRLLSEAVIST